MEAQHKSETHAHMKERIAARRKTRLEAQAKVQANSFGDTASQHIQDFMDNRKKQRMETEMQEAVMHPPGLNAVAMGQGTQPNPPGSNPFEDPSSTSNM